MHHREAVGARVRAARVRAKLRQADVAKRIGISQGTLSKVERGKLALSAEDAASIAKICRVSLSKLLEAA